MKNKLFWLLKMIKKKQNRKMIVIIIRMNNTKRMNLIMIIKVNQSMK
jgi:hypothetical protein